VAKKLGVSKRTLQRSTAGVLGMSPLEFIQEIRLDQAAFLLRTTNRTAISVAAAVGYQNVGTLGEVAVGTSSSDGGYTNYGGFMSVGRGPASQRH